METITKQLMPTTKDIVAEVGQDDYPAITIKQPWAWTIMAGHKTIENRTWRTRKLGPMVIHAAKSRTGVAGNVLWLRNHGIDCPDADALDYGCIVGLIRVETCLDMSEVEPGMFVEGPVCWVLKEPRAIERPIPYKGQQGLFRVPRDLVADQLQ